MAQQISPVDYANLPAGSPPPGILPDFEHGETREVEAYIGMGICIGIAFIFMVLRFYVKLCITRLWGWDDLACVLGWITILCHDVVAFTQMGPDGGLGFHLWDIRLSRLGKEYLQGTLASITLYAVSAFCVKLSLFLLYLRLFKPNKITRWLIYGGMAACVIFYSASIIRLCALCPPRPVQPDDSASWLLRSAECAPRSLHVAIAQAVFGTISDIYLLVIPVQSIFQLQLPVERKFGVSAIFMVGVIAIACSLGSLGYRVTLLYETDHTWFGISVYIFSAAEISAGIICSCMPILAALFRGNTTRKFQFPSLRYFSSPCSASRGSRSSRRPFDSNKRISAHRLQPDGSLDHGNSNYVELENGTRFAKPSNGIMVTRAVPVF